MGGEALAGTRKNTACGTPSWAGWDSLVDNVGREGQRAEGATDAERTRQELEPDTAKSCLVAQRHTHSSRTVECFRKARPKGQTLTSFTPLAIDAVCEAAAVLSPRLRSLRACTRLDEELVCSPTKREGFVVDTEPCRARSNLLNPEA